MIRPPRMLPDDYQATPVRVLKTVMRVAVDLLSVTMALLGLWIASTLAVYFNWPLVWALLAGLVVFPILPLLAEAWHRFDRRRYGESDEDHPPVKKRLLRFSLWINAALVVLLLLIFPRTVLTAAATRGDWMLEGLRGESASWLRGRLLAVVDGVEELGRSDDNPFSEFDDAKPKLTPRGRPTPEASPTVPATPAPPSAPEQTPQGEEPPSKHKPSPEAPKPPSQPPRAPETPVHPSDPRDEPPSEKPPGLVMPPVETPPPTPTRDVPPVEPTPTPDIPLPTPTPPSGGATERPPATRAPARDDPTEVPSTGGREGQISVDPDHDVPLIVVHGDEGRVEPGGKAPAAKTPKTPPSAVDDDAHHEHYVRWLAEPKVHPIVRYMPKSVETSYQTVAAYVAERTSDPFERVKALHDYIADRVRYLPRFDSSDPPPSEPDTVFRARAAVCAGYARLFKAMILSIGGEAVYISGEGRFALPGSTGGSHAWNGVKIGRRWYLVDVTWDAGHLRNGQFVKDYSTDYLLPPADLFGISHFPRDPAWQLVDTPLTRGEFLRQPLLLPRFFAYGLELIAPERGQVTVDGYVDVAVDNPKGHSLMFKYAAGNSSSFKKCDPSSSGAEHEAVCRFPQPDTYQVLIFAAYQGLVTHELVASLEVNSR